MGPFYQNRTTFLTCMIDALFVCTAFFTSAYSPIAEKSLLNILIQYIFIPFCIWMAPFEDVLTNMEGVFSKMCFVFFISLGPAFIYAWLLNRLYSLIHSDLTYFQKKNQGKM